MVNLNSSSYFADSIYDELIDQGVHITKINVIRDIHTNGEKYYKLDIPNEFSLLGKTAIYVGSIVSDDDLLDIQRIGFTLAHCGIKRRIFVIPFISYQTNDRATLPGEVVVSKVSDQMLSSLGATDDGNVFIFLDLHHSGLLHYFEGCCLRIELYANRALLDAVQNSGFDMTKIVIGAPDIRNSKWVNSYAKELDCPISFAIDRIENSSKVYKIIGDVKDKHVIMYTDLAVDFDLIICACDMYLASGATRVDVILSHFAVVNESEI